MNIRIALLSIAGAGLIGIGGISGYATDQTAHSHQQDKSQAKTFVGEVMRNPDNRDWMNYMVYDQNRQSNYFLDDDWKAQRYEGDKVQIVGTLDQKNDIIHIESIKKIG